MMSWIRNNLHFRQKRFFEPFNLEKLDLGSNRGIIYNHLYEVNSSPAAILIGHLFALLKWQISGLLFLLFW